MNKRHALALAASTQAASPEHKRFQTLLGKIDKARARLHSWQQQLPLFAQVHQQQVAPLLQRLNHTRFAWALELEQLQLSQKWSKVDRGTLSEMICNICGALLDTGEDTDPEIKALYNRHAEVDFDREGQQQLDEFKAALERMTGVDLGDDPVLSPDELLQRARASMAQSWEEAHAHAEAARDTHRRQARKPRKTAAQKRAEEDERRISQTVREVYRKLASALHPDRMPADTPPDVRAQATARMQRANVAYEAGDLLALLELQLQIEQVDLAHASRMAADQVRHFNKVLAGQLQELEAEIDGRQQAFCESYRLMTYRRLDPERLIDVIKEETRHLEVAQLQWEKERRRLGREPAQVKLFLKQWRLEQREADWGFDR
ncbi:MAG: J domain-containing protein [Rubrivivax sp.]|nr:J domain-containing protein [Rubrivivax sp.]